MAIKKKTANEKYPLLGFRVTEDIYNELTADLNTLLNEYNEDRNTKYNKKYKKNELFVKALKRGISQLKFEL